MKKLYFLKYLENWGKEDPKRLIIFKKLKPPIK